MQAEVVIDASVAAKWELRDEQYREAADDLRLRVRAGQLRLTVPAFWQYEIASISQQSRGPLAGSRKNGRAQLLTTF